MLIFKIILKNNYNFMGRRDKYKINSIEMKRYCGNFKKFWGPFIVVKKYKIISIEMKRYWKIFYSLFMHDG